MVDIRHASADAMTPSPGSREAVIARALESTRHGWPDVDEATRRLLEESLLDMIENPADETPWDEVKAELRARGSWLTD